MTDNLVQVGFDYDQLDPDIRTDVEAAGHRIHELERRTSESIVEIGQHLIRVKQQLPHGAFLPWLTAEFGWSDRTARNFMQVAEVFGGKSEIISDFAPTALIALASPSTPEDVRIDLTHLAAIGQKVTVADVKHAIEEHKPQIVHVVTEDPEPRRPTMVTVTTDEPPPFEEVDPSDPATFLEPIRPTPIDTPWRSPNIAAQLEDDPDDDDDWEELRESTPEECQFVVATIKAALADIAAAADRGDGGTVSSRDIHTYLEARGEDDVLIGIVVQTLDRAEAMDSIVNRTK